MARNVNDIISALPAARRRKIENRARLLISEEMSLQELRRAREMTEVEMASVLGVAQKQISDIEKRTDNSRVRRWLIMRSAGNRIRMLPWQTSSRSMALPGRFRSLRCMPIAGSPTDRLNGWSVPTNSATPDCPRSRLIRYSKICATTRDTPSFSTKCACRPRASQDHSGNSVC